MPNFDCQESNKKFDKKIKKIQAFELTKNDILEFLNKKTDLA